MTFLNDGDLTIFIEETPIRKRRLQVSVVVALSWAVMIERNIAQPQVEGRLLFGYARPANAENAGAHLLGCRTAIEHD